MKRTKQEWEELIREYEISNKTQTSWCEEKGINSKIFNQKYYAVKKSRKEKESKSSWIKLEQSPNEDLTSINIPQKNKYSTTQNLEIQIDKLKIKVPATVDEDVLRKICKVLVSIC